jgi:hypothetical protein
MNGEKTFYFFALKMSAANESMTLSLKLKKEKKSTRNKAGVRRKFWHFNGRKIKNGEYDVFKEWRMQQLSQPD